jgi:hypothetical protein
MTVDFLQVIETNEAEATLVSDDQSVLVNLVHTGYDTREVKTNRPALPWDLEDIALYTVFVYARYEWQRVDAPGTRQFMYESRPEAERSDLPWKEAFSYASSLIRDPREGGGV